MALLTKEQRQARFKYLGLGEYNKENIKKFQKKYLRSRDVDGVYGTNTDNLLRHVYNVKKYTKNFSPEEFKCECGGRYCTGYPTYMKKVELENLQSIRAHFGKPMTITCGMRCRPYNNSLRGSISNSKHLTGYATDFYMKGVTDTLANRKSSIRWIKKLPNHNYTYGNGINSYGFRLSAPYMGNALHTDTNKPITTAASIGDLFASTAAAAATTSKSKSKPQKAVDYAKKLANDDSWHYVVWNGNDKKTQLCPICHDYPKGKYHGFNCIRFVFSCWRHGGGIDCKCDGGLIHNSLGNKMLKAKTDKEALKMAQAAIGCKNIKIIRNKNGIPQSKLKPGDACLNFSGSTYKHLFLYAGNGKMVDCGRWSDTKKQIAVRKAVSCKIAIRYVEPAAQATTTTATKKKTKKLTNREKLAKCAWDYAYHSSTKKANYPKGAAKPAYKLALDKAFGKKRRWSTPAKKGASCDVFVATCIRMAGIDKHAPRGMGRSYLDKSKKFKRVKVNYKTIKDGDIISIIWKNGNPHWCMAYKGYILEASYGGWYPKRTNTLKSRLSKSGKSSVVVYRAV